jgi:hypothetical protein
VPAHFWASKDGTRLSEQAEIDFMHFQAGGHTLLANEVVEYLIYSKRVNP